MYNSQWQWQWHIWLYEKNNRWGNPCRAQLMITFYRLLYVYSHFFHVETTHFIYIQLNLWSFCYLSVTVAIGVLRHAIRKHMTKRSSMKGISIWQSPLQAPVVACPASTIGVVVWPANSDKGLAEVVVELSIVSTQSQSCKKQLYILNNIPMNYEAPTWRKFGRGFFDTL